MARRVSQKSASELRVGDVTIYGVLMGKHEIADGYLMDYPGGPIRIDFQQSLPVFCRASQIMLEAIDDALQERKREEAERFQERTVVVERKDQLGWL